MRASKDRQEEMLTQTTEDMNAEKPEDKQEQVAAEPEKTFIQKVDEWKSQYKKVYLSTISMNEFIWRRLKRSEYIGITNKRSGTTVDEIIAGRQYEIIKTVVLEPQGKQLDDLLLEYEGILVSLSDEILDKSGFSIYSTEEL